ncbi:urea transporter [Cecembia calidifontis]|jgi:urea transporter/murein DD-endopeptidase MepM/ murein hydrolase activator NlpD|uniref:Urea transporter n=1 Tax=Cecembia calidifontis TaxID=1187080 RepID=A0A4Q7PCA9_9BACT|nr:urea transporter [Cecembia calidifontis]RZS97941.1 urea transporter [Cecembia calidifontis]
MKRLQWFPQALFNSYAQVFFSNNKWFGIILLLLTFIDFYVGLYGLISVATALLTAYFIGLYEFNIRQGYYGFNALLVGVGLAIYFQPGPLLLFLIVVSGILTLFISLAFEGFLGKYGLPFLSLPFITVFWLLRLASRQFEALGLSERGIYVLNELYILGGSKLVTMYEWWNQIPFPSSLKTYFLSLGAIFFQQNVFAGVFAALGLLIYSRIGFTLSLLGFYTAYLFYFLLKVPFTEISFSYIGFNYILTAVALGGFFIIPNKSSYLSLLLIIPMVTVLSISLQEILNIFYLPVHSFPFNLAVLTVLYGLKFRTDNRIGLSTIFWQQNSPEKNLYQFTNFMERFGKKSPIPIYLPFFGEWTVTQGHNGPYTHKDDWKHAWDFEIMDEEGKTFKNQGDFPSDYYGYDKNILAPADGTIEEVVNEIEENPIGTRNLEKNWGNTIIIKHADFLYSKLSHLKKGSIIPKKGDKVKRGDIIARMGNSGNSPYPHLHFQIQATPYIGSKTIDYPLSDVWMRYQGKESLKSVANPPMGAVVSSLTPHPVLKKAFSFVIGDQLKFNDEDGKEIVWHVKRDYYTLIRYLECETSGSKAYFRLDDAMLHFTHFEGDRKSVLYLFFLAAYKVSFGFTNGLELKDSFPVNIIFDPRKIILQDFFAPFYRYLKGDYSLKYPENGKGLSLKPLELKSKVIKSSFGRSLETSSFEFVLDHTGIKRFQFPSKSSKHDLSWIEAS